MADRMAGWGVGPDVSVRSQGSVWEDGEGLAGGHRGWAKGLYLSGAGPWGGDGIGVSGDAAG